MKIILSFIISIIFLLAKQVMPKPLSTFLYSLTSKQIFQTGTEKIKFLKTDFKGETVKVIVQYSVLTNRSIDNIQVLSDSPKHSAMKRSEY